MRDEEIARECVLVAKTALNSAAVARREGYAALLRSAHQKRFKSAANRTRRVDLLVQEVIDAQLKVLFPSLLILGEEVKEYPETLLDVGKEIVCIVDPVDGTDLLARGFSNWCCSLLVFSPKQRRIRAAVVAHSDGNIYWATDEGAFRGRYEGGHPEEHRLVVRRAPSFSLRKASVCFYGQKPTRLINTSFSFQLDKLRQSPEDSLPQFRIYNFAGNPMMVRIPDGAVDIVFELTGQEVHDVLPGAYIATQAGAVICDPDGQDIDLIHSAFHPQQKIKYVLAATKGLQREFLQLVGRQENVLNTQPTRRRSLTKPETAS